MFLALPLLVYISFDSSAAIGKPQTNRFGAFKRCPGLKGKTSLGDIQDNAAVVRVEIDIGGSVHSHPWTVASFRPHGHYSPCHPRLKITVLYLCRDRSVAQANAFRAGKWKMLLELHLPRIRSLPSKPMSISCQGKYLPRPVLILRR